MKNTKEKTYFLKSSFRKVISPKIIFLDVDGVLNCHPIKNENYDLEEHLLDNLELITKKTKAYIMLTSSWSFGLFSENDEIKSNSKYCQHLLNELKKRNIELVGYSLNTISSKYSRSQSILDFLDECNPAKYIIIDDEIFDFKEKGLGEYFIQTYFDNNDELGLSGSKVKKAIELLNRY